MKKKFYVCRFIIDSATDADRNQDIVNAILQSKILVVGQTANGFLGVKRFRRGGKQILTGTFYRAKKNHTQGVIDHDADRINEVQLKNAIKGQVTFFFDTSTHLIVWENYHRLPISDFVKWFARVVEYTLNDLSVVSLHLLNDSTELKGFMEKLHLVEKIKLNLRPTNPNPIKGVEDYDKLLREYNISVQEVIESINSRRGIDIGVLEAFHVSAKLLLIKEGYGDGEIIGKDMNGTRVSYNSKAMPVMREFSSLELKTEKDKIKHVVDIFKEMEARSGKVENQEDMRQAPRIKRSTGSAAEAAKRQQDLMEAAQQQRAKGKFKGRSRS